VSWTPGRPPYLTDNYEFPVPGGQGPADYLTANIALADAIDSQLKETDTFVADLEASHPSVVANLPTADLVDGQEIYYQTTAMAATGTMWHLRYRAAAPSPNRWEYLGGGPIEQTINEGTGGGGTWDGPLPTGLQPLPNGPSIVIPRPGDYAVTYGVALRCEAGVQIGIDGGGPAADAAPMIELESDGEAIGSIKMFAGTTIPENWMLADGSSLLQANYPDLFAIMGTRYGQVDATHFSLPDLRSKFVYGAASAAAAVASGGEATHLLSNAEMPLHAHSGATTGGTSGAYDTNHYHNGSTGYMNANNVHAHTGTADAADPMAGRWAATTPSGITWTGASGSGQYYSVRNGGSSDWGGNSGWHQHTFTTSAVDINHVHAFQTGWQSDAYATNNHSHSIPALGIYNDGGSTPHNNLPPYLTAALIIKVAGQATLTGSLSVRRSINSANSTLSMWANTASARAYVASRFIHAVPIKVA